MYYVLLLFALFLMAPQKILASDARLERRAAKILLGAEKDGGAIIRFDYAPKPKKKKKALMLSMDAKADHNGIFNEPPLLLLGALSLEHAVAFRRIKNLSEVQDAVANFVGQNGRIDFLHIGGHGTEQAISLSEGARFEVTSATLPLLTALFSDKYLTEDAQIFLLACRVGGFYEPKNLVDQVYEIAGGRRVVGPSASSGVKTVSFAKIGGQGLAVSPLALSLIGSSHEKKGNFDDHQDITYFRQSDTKDVYISPSKFQDPETGEWNERKAKEFAGSDKKKAFVKKKLAVMRERQHLYDKNVRRALNNLIFDVDSNTVLYNPNAKTMWILGMIDPYILEKVSLIKFTDGRDTQGIAETLCFRDIKHGCRPSYPNVRRIHLYASPILGQSLKELVESFKPTFSDVFPAMLEIALIFTPSDAERARSHLHLMGEFKRKNLGIDLSCHGFNCP